MWWDELRYVPTSSPAQGPVNSMVNNNVQGIYDLGHPFTAHDVRKLRLCATCGRLGYLPQMLTLNSKNHHGACIVATMTHEQVLGLPTEQAAKLRLNETGPELMNKLLDQAGNEEGGA